MASEGKLLLIIIGLILALIVSISVTITVCIKYHKEMKANGYYHKEKPLLRSKK